MAAKKAPAKKAPMPPAPKPPAPKNETGMGLAKSLPKSKVDKKSQAGDLGSERATMRKVQQFNNARRAANKEYGFGIAAVTYRDKSGKLKDTTVNIQRKKKK